MVLTLCLQKTSEVQDGYSSSKNAFFSIYKWRTLILMNKYKKHVFHTKQMCPNLYSCYVYILKSHMMQNIYISLFSMYEKHSYL